MSTSKSSDAGDLPCFATFPDQTPNFPCTCLFTFFCNIITGEHVHTASK